MRPRVQNKRDRLMGFKVFTEERAHIINAARAAGMLPAAFMRQAVIERVHKNAPTAGMSPNSTAVDAPTSASNG